MSHVANVRSMPAMERFRGAMVQFGEEASQALEEVRMELDRFVEWLEHEQTAYWRGEVRRAEARAAEAKIDLHRARAATIDPEHTPSCLQEQKALEQAKRRLVQAEEKLESVKSWVPAIRQAVQDYQTQSAPLVNALLYELPQGVTFVRKLVSRLDDYVALQAPTAPPISAGEASGQGVATQHIAVAAKTIGEDADEPA